jgi:hypothetical protein
MESKKENKENLKLTAKNIEKLELLQKTHESKGQQLRIDATSGDLTEINEIREIIGKKFEDPEEKYNIYYKGIQNVLISHLPKGKQHQEARQLIYDEKNIFLNRGLKKSDGNGVRGSDGRMTYQEKMNEMLDLVITWVSESQNPMDLYNMLYNLNEKHGYGHENYDDTAISFSKAMKDIQKL